MYKARLVDEVWFKSPNKPGTLAKVCSSLCQKDINLEAMTAWGEGDTGFFSLVTNDSNKTYDTIVELGYKPVLKKIVCVELTNKPGCGLHLIETLAHNGLGINYWYYSNSGCPVTWVYFSCTDNEKAVKLLA